MMPFDSFVNSDVAVSFNSDSALFKQELIAFLTLCASHNLKWCSGDDPVDKDMMEYIPVGSCISISHHHNFGRTNRDGLLYSEEKSYTDSGYTIVPSTDFFKKDSKFYAVIDGEKLPIQFPLPEIEVIPE